MSKPRMLMVFGPCASGKSWVCKQLSPDKFNYVSYDGNSKKDHSELLSAHPELISVYDPNIKISTTIKRMSDKFDIRCVAIIPDFIILKSQLKGRGGKITKSTYSRYRQIKARAKKYAEFQGDSDAVLKYVNNIKWEIE